MGLYGDVIGISWDFMGDLVGFHLTLWDFMGLFGDLREFSHGIATIVDRWVCLKMVQTSESGSDKPTCSIHKIPPSYPSWLVFMENPKLPKLDGKSLMT